MATQEPQTQAKYAYRKVVRGADGAPIIIYIDAQTGQRVQDVSGYQIISAGNKNSLSSPAKATPEKDEDNKTTAETIREEAATGGEGPEVSGLRDTVSSNGNGFSGIGINNPFDRSVNNNYGYIDTPGFLGPASMIPGPIGTVAGAVNKASRVSNTIANNKARETVPGLDGLKAPATVGNLLGVRDTSKVADVTIGWNNPYSIGFEALNRAGQTTLTPTEARRRSLIMDEPVHELSRKQSRHFQNSFREEQGQKGIGGLVSRASQGIRGLIDGIFGGDRGISESSFPDAPSGYSGPTSYTNDPWGVGESQGKSSGGGQSDPWGGLRGDSDDGSSNSSSSSNSSGLGGWDGW